MNTKNSLSQKNTIHSNFGDHPTFSQMLKIFARIGFLSFGGPAAQIALIHREIVDKKKWISENQFLNALSFCMLLPGPEAMQLATYSGWCLYGKKGGIVAGLLFVLPGSILVLALASIYAVYGDLPVIKSVFVGIKATVLVIVLNALIQITKRAFKQKAHLYIAGLSFFCLLFFITPFSFGSFFCGNNWFFIGKIST